MAIGRWQAFLSRIVPGFLRGRYFGSLLESLGLTLDSATQALQDGIHAANPLLCESDALPLIARDRRIRLYPTETDASKRKRLAAWMDIKRLGGMARGIFVSLQPYFLPGVIPTCYIVFQIGDGSGAVWYKADPAGNVTRHIQTPSNWDFDGVTWKTITVVNDATNANPIVVGTGVPHGLAAGQYVKIVGVTGNTAANGVWPISSPTLTHFSIPVAGNGGYSGGGTVAVNYRYRFWVIIETTGTRIDGSTLYDDGHHYNGGQVYDGTAAANAVDIIGIINDSKRAATVMWGLILCPSGSFSPTGTAVTLADGSTSYPAGNWGPIVDPVTHLPTRPAYASFYKDLGQA